MPTALDPILKKALENGRISAEEALSLLKNGDFIPIMATAREIRNRKNDPLSVSYTMFRIVNYTSICRVKCAFCSFYHGGDRDDGYVLAPGDIVARMREAVSLGANQLFLQGGVNPDLDFDYYLEVLRTVKKELGPDIHIRAFSPVELLEMERGTGRSLNALLGELKDAGLDSVPGAGAEILSERMRRILSPNKASVEEWVEVMKTCHREGLPGSANIVFGSEETPEEIIEHLRIIRDLQDETGGFLSFIPWTFQRQTKDFRVRDVPAHEFLKVLGICRIFLDNIDHLESSVLVQGTGVGSLALYAGADDISSVVIEENVLRSYAPRSEEQAREFIRTAGFQPRQRDLNYRILTDVVS